jgi:hypothetical protein
MVNRIDRNTARENQQSNTAANSHRRYPSKQLSPNTSNEINRIDDVIASLANAHENRRARQVGEWENMLKQYVH